MDKTKIKNIKDTIVSNKYIKKIKDKILSNKYIKENIINLTIIFISFILLLGLESTDIISNMLGYILFPILYVVLFNIYKGNYLFFIYLIIIILFSIWGSILEYRQTTIAYKPVIYLYPENKQIVKIELDYNGEIIADYPEYDEKIKGWEVEAYPDSRIIDLRDGKEYSYLFWEGQPEKPIDWDLDTGFVVEGKDSRAFLQKTLSDMGMTPKEYNEFIVYWYPKMMNNKYTYIHFAKEKYTQNAPLEITPQPDSMLRVFMLIKPLNEKIKIKPQILDKFERTGFSVVEWGGTELE